LRYDLVDDVDRDGEPDPGIRAGGGKNRRGDADQAAGGIEQRSSGIARIDRRIGLNDVGQFAPLTGRQPPPQGADDTGGERMVESERIADGEGPLSDLKIGRTADGDRFRQLARVAQMDDGEVVIGSRADDLRVDDFTRRHAHFDAARSLHDMIVGDDVPGLVPDEAGAGLHPDDLIAFRRDLLLGRAAADHLQHRRRHGIEDCDGRALGLGQVAARLDRTRAPAREQKLVEIGLRENRREQDQHSGEQRARQSVGHVRLLCNGLLCNGQVAKRRITERRSITVLCARSVRRKSDKLNEIAQPYPSR
jgi:hypothetical protein